MDIALLFCVTRLSCSELVKIPEFAKLCVYIPHENSSAASCGLIILRYPFFLPQPLSPLFPRYVTIAVLLTSERLGLINTIT